MSALPHFPKTESAGRILFYAYTVKRASRIFLTSFLIKPANRDLASHTAKWKGSPTFPADHLPSFSAHTLNIIPRKARARLQRILLQNLSIGHYHRRQHPASNICLFCASRAPNSIAPAETLQHLFHTCPLAQRVWALTRQHLWVKALSSPIPRDEYSLVTGDAFHLTPPPPRTFWNVLHTSTVSRIYIERCNLVYNRGEVNLIKQSADIFGAVKSDIKEAIRASWST